MGVAAVSDAPLHQLRPSVRGKFIFLGDEKMYVRGVTYGTFRPSETGAEFPDAEVVRQDLAQMAAIGLNAFRTYTVPPLWLLDIAHEQGLFVMVGLPWEQHIAFLDDGERARQIEQRIRTGVRQCSGHPAVLCYAVGNEIPAPIVRWHGGASVERFLDRLCAAVKAEDPGSLVTYVNYPSTEYLQLPFVDLVCFNVYLESEQGFEAYLARLQNLSGDRPLVMAELGLDSRRHGEDAQARTLHGQIRTAMASGCAGAFVFAWTDEWHRGGHDIEDWDFGVTDRNHEPKPALAAVHSAFEQVPFPDHLPWPRVSVVVCSHNGESTLGDCLEGLRRLDYPEFEVIVVDDGSTDGTALLADRYGFRVITTENRGLASARNTGLEASSGEIVAYLDDDARPDPHWLRYLAATFLSGSYAGVGGPNIAPPDGGSTAACVANAPGGPIHVLLSDREAEHIPGCNMAFRRECLEAIGGFDPRFVTAGDDVDVCWALQREGWTLGFSPAAVVWHHRRSSIRAYLKQQLGYGKAEALLERKWPEKYNARGHLSWSGRLYGNGLPHALGRRRWRVYYGTWGNGLFQSIDRQVPGRLQSLLHMPEWYLVMTALAGVALVGTLWRPLLLMLVPLALAVGAVLIQAGLSARKAVFPNAPTSSRSRFRLKALTAVLYLLQPAARLRGRLSYGLTPWRRRAGTRLALPRPREFVVWNERWEPPAERLRALEADLRANAAVVRGGDYDRWELEVWGGLLGCVRLRMATEEHGAGTQLFRFRSWPRCSAIGLLLTGLLAALAAAAAAQEAWAAGGIVAAVAIGLALSAVHDCAAATAVVARTLERKREAVEDLAFALEHELRVRTVTIRGAVEERGATGS